MIAFLVVAGMLATMLPVQAVVAAPLADDASEQTISSCCEGACSTSDDVGGPNDSDEGACLPGCCPDGCAGLMCKCCCARSVGLSGMTLLLPGSACREDVPAERRKRLAAPPCDGPFHPPQN